MKAARTARDAAYYLSLNYAVLVRALGPEEGGGFIATIPQLGSATFVADGETREEALQALDALREQLIPELVEQGVELPEPEPDVPALEEFSGNLVLRIPRGLHGRLARAAKKNGCSINKLATEILAAGIERSNVLREADRVLKTMIEDLQKRLEEQIVTTRQRTGQQRWLRSNVDVDAYDYSGDKAAA